LIDLHCHTTASDGRCTPAELVRRAAAAGVTVLSVTDHDTVAACDAVAAACRSAAIEFVPGIEVTSILEGTDVHILGYFVDVTSPALHAFLRAQRQARLDRVRAIVDRLASHSIALDADAIIQPAVDDPSRAVGRPWIARALVSGGHVKDISEAFDRWLATGRPAFVPRAGAPPEGVVAVIHDADGIASLAHPALLRHDDWVHRIASHGLDALEAYHSKHDAAATERYRELARTLGLAVSGGSDYHADDAHGPGGPGSVSLPPAEYDALRARWVRHSSPASA
jgi:predicted metal-dependent phosphoesterase TrpH